jgi:undecaprenyl diphosphate synthase
MKECRHVAIIMDGNGRWAKAKGMPRTAGHKVGADNVRTIAIAANELGVKYLTLYAFSTENWKRSNDEVNYLMKLPAYLFKMYMKEFLERGFRIRLIGDLSALPEATRKVLLDAADESKDNTGLSLIIAINYGSRDEIRRAVKSIAEKVKAGELEPEEIEEETISDALDTRDFPDIDLLIRTSGEQRISNYLLWQIAYAELEFVPESWPEFTPEVLARCIEEYTHRDRRFGGVTNE